MTSLTLGSLFDGSGGFPLGALLNGITPVWASEIEPFPIRVTTKRLPQMKHYGDICKLNGAELPPVDIISFGSPCQNFSLASNNRNGLEGSKSSLFFEAVRVIKEMREATNGRFPRFIVFENVPGIFSSGKSEDYRRVLEEIVKIKDESLSVPLPENSKWLCAGEICGCASALGDDFSIAWRTLQASSWGVAQRRRRIFLIADLGGYAAPKILFEFEGVSGYTPKSRNAWQTAAKHAGKGTAESGRVKPVGLHCLGFEPGAMSRLGGHVTEDGICTLRASMGDNRAAVAIENHPADSRVQFSSDGKVQTLTSRAGTGGGSVPMVLSERLQSLPVSKNIAQTLMSSDFKGVQCVCEERKAYGICSDKSNSFLSDNPKSGIYEADTSRTLDGNCNNPTCNQGGIAVVETYALQGSMIGRKNENGPRGSGIQKDVSFCLNTCDKHSVVYSLDRASYNQGKNAQYDISITDDGIAQTLVGRGPGAVAEAKKEAEYVIRRLTTLECARLMGLPDDWCLNLETENPTDEDIAFWSEVFETHRKITGTSTKPKSRNQIVKWLKNPYSDSAAYKMFGNGIVIQCAEFIFAGIVWANKLLE